jgi:hypothetical protein
MNSINTEKVFFIFSLVGSILKYVRKKRRVEENTTKISFKKASNEF